MLPEALCVDSRLLVTLLLVMIVHWRVNPTINSDMKFIAQWLQQAFTPTRTDKANEDNSRNARVSESMREVRVKTYVTSSRIFVHTLVPILLFILSDLLRNPSSTGWAQMGFLLLGYSMHWSVASGALCPMPHQMRGVCAGWYALMVAFALLAPCHPGRDALFFLGFKIGNRLTMTAVFLDSKMSFVFQALISVASLVSDLVIHNTGQEAFMLLAMEVQHFVGAMTLSATLEFLIRSRIHALLDVADAETLVSSFQHVLRGICDGDILLTSDMTIHGPGECLQHLLMNRANLDGKAFEMLLPPDERQRFADFINTSTKCALEPAHGARMTPPTCLRVSLCGASNTRVPADIFHVPVPHLFGADHPYHLLAISVDSESRNPPALTQDIPDMAKILERSERQRSRTATSSGTSTASSVWEPLPELAGMMLLVDGSSPFLDIEQAHLSFERRVGDDERESSKMPSLRKVCRRTDWESIRNKIDRFVSGEGAAQELRSICLRMPDDRRRFLKAKCVQMSAFESRHEEDSQDQSITVPMKICLQLSHFVQDESRLRKQSELAGIRELHGRRPASVV
ncbi:unnamed protein product [Symbiodinium microadriaticum]|nr:unnamed protein product [Symbiodinium sp. KB8]CAE7556821.1 unnamed protein product [Symbiodinium microadriaticum]